MTVKVKEKDGPIVYIAKGNYEKGFSVRYNIKMKEGHDDLSGHIGHIGVDLNFETYWFKTEGGCVSEGGMRLLIKLGRKILKELNK